MSLTLFISLDYHLEIVDVSQKVKNSFYTSFMGTRDLSKVYTTGYSKFQRKIEIGVCEQYKFFLYFDANWSESDL